MFEKFTDTARATLLVAKDIAVSFDQNHINTGHLLAAIAGGFASTPEGGNPPVVSPKVEAVIAALGTTQDVVINRISSHLAHGTGTNPANVPFTPTVKNALEFALRSSMMLGDNHIGPEHLLAGLVRTEGSVAAKVLARLGITEDTVHAAIRDSTPAPSPTAARICAVYLPVGTSVFKNGGKVYPDLASAEAAHPGAEIAPFTIPLADGEFFDVGASLPWNLFKSHASFADYPAAFAAAEEFKKSASGYEILVRIMVPDVQELRGKDSRGHHVVLGRSVEYSRVTVTSRLSAKAG